MQALYTLNMWLVCILTHRQVMISEISGGTFKIDDLLYVNHEPVTQIATYVRRYIIFWSAVLAGFVAGKAFICLTAWKQMGFLSYQIPIRTHQEHSNSGQGQSFRSDHSLVAALHFSNLSGEDLCVCNFMSFKQRLSGETTASVVLLLLLWQSLDKI